MTRLLLALSAPLIPLCVGCSDHAPAADPAAVDRLVASFEAPPAKAKPDGAALPASVEKKIESADRLTGSLVKVEPERVDPDLAAALIAR